MQNQPENKKTTLPVITEVSENAPIKVKNTAERRKSKFQPFDSYLDFEIKSDEDAKDNGKSEQEEDTEKSYDSEEVGADPKNEIDIGSDENKKEIEYEPTKIKK